MLGASPCQIVRTIPVLIAICLFALPAPAQYSGGSGTADDPYQIATAADLIALGETPEDYDKHFILTADIDLDPNLPGGKVFDRAVIAPDVNDDEDWFQGIAFAGLFDGNGHTISHLTISGQNHLGLFGHLGPGANVSNLGLEAVDISGTGRVGGLVGSLGDFHTWTGAVIRSCYSTGSVTGDGAGGLVGDNCGTIIASYSTCSVSGNCVGGLVGRNYSWFTLIKSCYSTGSVTGDYAVGGLVGSNSEGSITSCYSIGSVTGTGDYGVGGLVGYVDDGFITSSCWDMETSGQFGSHGGFGLTTVDMMDPEILGLNGVLTHDPNWVLDAGRDYPRLAWEGTPGQGIPEPVIDWIDGQGTEQEPYRIATADQLILLSRASALWGKHFILCADIDLDPNLPGRRIFSQAVFQIFSGVFDGNGHTISHLTITGGSYSPPHGNFGGVGLFGALRSGATVSNLGLEAVDIDGVWYAGGLAALNSASITNCYSRGTVSGNGSVGGLAAGNGGIITNCYSAGSVNGGTYVGGLVGNAGGVVTNCYSTCVVSGNAKVGGLVGGGNVSIRSSFWDMEASGIAVSGGGIGLTTAEMMDPYMLGLNGFANDPNWVLDAGRDYPRLVWEGTPGQAIPDPIIDWLDGQGIEEEPYRVDTADQLILLGKASILWDKHLMLGADIDLDPNLPGRRVFSQALIQVFSGVFDGNGHAISHLTVTGETNLALFRELVPGAVVSNLGLEAVDVDGTGDCVAGLVGSNNGSITHCYRTGMVKGSRYVGGLVGNNSGSITDSYSTGSVTGDLEVGGLVGAHDGVSITSCNSNSSVKGSGSVGGLVGTNDGPVTDSYSTGTVSGGSCIGGLVGRNERDGSITMSYSTSAVNGSSDVGGLVGGNSGSSNTDYDGIITMSYSSGPVSGYEDVGGLVGTNAGRITDCYSTGSVTGHWHVAGLVGYGGSGDITNSYCTGSVTGDFHVGGLVGDRYGSITSSFWDVETSGLSSSDGGIGKTTAEMQTAKTFLDAGWDFVGETANGTEDLWWIDEGKDYPRLWWELTPKN